jgi:multiple sugar transport system permease protein
VFAVSAVVLNVVVGLALAVLLNRRLPVTVRKPFPLDLFFPGSGGPHLHSGIWQFLYQQDTGVINYYLGFLGIGPIPWLSSTQWVLPSVIIMDIWKNAGFAMLIFLAGLQGIPRDYGEAAEIDGATSWQTSGASRYRS